MQGKELLTSRQLEIFNSIKSFIAKNNYSPSIRDLCKLNNINSPSAIYYHLKYLETIGLINRAKGVTRAIDVSDPYNKNDFDDDSVLVPLLGQIAAGSPILAEENIETKISVSKQIAGSGEIFALTVKGDSMIGAGILNGDIVIVRSQNHANNGDIVAALIDDEATVKTFQLETNENGSKQVWLIPHNDSYEKIDGTYTKIMGKIVSLIRKI